MNQQIKQAIQYRDNYQEYVASLPASIYNANVEIYQANLERMNQEIDRLIEEAEAENEVWKMNAKLVEKTPVNDMDALHNYIVAAEAGDKWLGEVEAEHADWLDNQRTMEDARF